MQHEMASSKTIGDYAIPHTIVFTILISESTGETTYGHHFSEKQYVTEQKSQESINIWVSYPSRKNKQTSMLVLPAPSSYSSSSSLNLAMLCLAYRLRIALLSTLFACASRYLQHVSVYLHAFVHPSSLLSASLIL